MRVVIGGPEPEAAGKSPLVFLVPLAALGGAAALAIAQGVYRQRKIEEYLYRHSPLEEFPEEKPGGAEEVRPEEAEPGYALAADVWSRAHDEGKERIARNAGWVTKKGGLSPTGRKIARSSWEELSPAAQEVIVRTLAHKELEPEEKPGGAEEVPEELTERELIEVKKIPAYSTARKLYIPKDISTLSNKDLLRLIGKSAAILHAERLGILPADYYVGVADAGGVGGKTPKDMWLLANIKFIFDEANKEFKRRGLDRKYDFFIEIIPDEVKEAYRGARPRTEPEPEKSEEPTKLQWDAEYDAVIERIDEMDLPDEVEYWLKKIARYDVKAKEENYEANMIIKSSPVGQPPPILDRVMDKVIQYNETKAKFWNRIRDYYIIPDTGHMTLWQVAIEAGLPVERYGEEKHIDFYVEDILDAIDQVRRKAHEKETLELEHKKFTDQLPDFMKRKIQDIFDTILGVEGSIAATVEQLNEDLEYLEKFSYLLTPEQRTLLQKIERPRNITWATNRETARGFLRDINMDQHREAVREALAVGLPPYKGWEEDYPELVPGRGAAKPEEKPGDAEKEPRTEWDFDPEQYALNVLEKNPIRRYELKYYCPDLEWMIIKKEYKPHNIPREIWYKAWNEYFKTHDKIMVYSTYPKEEHWYVDVHGNPTPGEHGGTAGSAPRIRYNVEGLSERDRGRLNTQLEKLINDDGKVKTMLQYIEDFRPTYKTHRVREYSEKRINLEYKKLAKPKDEYTLWRASDGLGIPVPKLIYDAIDLPEGKPEDEAEPITIEELEQ